MEEGSANDNLEEFGPVDDVNTSLRTDAEVEVLEGLICID